MKKRLLMLGCGPMQAVAIRCAKEKGWEVFGVDGDPHAYAKNICDYFEPIDLKDIDKLIQFAQKIKTEKRLDGVFTAATDFSFAVARIASACNLPGHSVEAAYRATDKIHMRTCFDEYDIPSPKWAEINKNTIHSYKQILKSKGLDFPLVVKPADNMGARGCRRVDSLKELEKGMEKSIRYSRSGRIIIEEYMNGPEFSLEALVFNDSIVLTGCADRHIYFSPYFIEMGHTIPSNCKKEDKNLLVNVFFKGIRALGLTHGVAKGDVKLTEKGAMIGEIAARLSGGYMSGWTYPYASGLLLTDKALDLAIGKIPLDLEETRNWVSAERAWISIPGKIATIIGLEKAKTLPYIKNVISRYQVGDEVDFPKNNVQKCGNCISLSPKRELAIEFCMQAVQEIFIRLEPHNIKTETFLFAEKTKEKKYPPQVFSIPLLENSFADKIYYPFTFPIPNDICNCMETKRDWYNRNIKDALKKALEIEPNLSIFLSGLRLQEKTRAWNAFLKGGIQGIIYVYDCAYTKK